MPVLSTSCPARFLRNVTQVEAIYQESVGPSAGWTAPRPTPFSCRLLLQAVAPRLPAEEFGGDGDEMMKRMIRDMMFMCPLRPGSGMFWAWVEVLRASLSTAFYSSRLLSRSTDQPSSEVLQEW